MLNKVMLIGRLGADPELRFTADGKAVATFRLAADSGYGERRQTEWVSVVCWERLAELANERVAKGSLVYVEGRLHTRSWEGQDGQRRSRTEVVANTVLFLDRRAGSAEDSGNEGLEWEL